MCTHTCEVMSIHKCKELQQKVIGKLATPPTSQQPIIFSQTSGTHMCRALLRRQKDEKALWRPRKRTVLTVRQRRERGWWIVRHKQLRVQRSLWISGPQPRLGGKANFPNVSYEVRLQGRALTNPLSLVTLEGSSA